MTADNNRSPTNARSNGATEGGRAQIINDIDVISKLALLAILQDHDLAVANNVRSNVTRAGTIIEGGGPYARHGSIARPRLESIGGRKAPSAPAGGGTTIVASRVATTTRRVIEDVEPKAQVQAYLADIIGHDDHSCENLSLDEEMKNLEFVWGVDELELHRKKGCPFMRKN